MSKMSATTKKALEIILPQIEIGKEYAEKELRSLICSLISWDTFRKYVTVDKVFNSHAEPISLEELVDLLNSCAGDDCYDCRWDFQIIDGQVFDVIAEERYIVRRLKES